MGWAPDITSVAFLDKWIRELFPKNQPDWLTEREYAIIKARYEGLDLAHIGHSYGQGWRPATTRIMLAGAVNKMLKANGRDGFGNVKTDKRGTS